ncbi:MAG: MerR family transcriptional regulator [Defluviitaleaceae bacterium]|nr:MerR family transcriptional regulator [Defluviitaleaceae bacterium]MCL2836112.1 MerR family transcriptional regulator [Defluviitaleaceae bacterium]
MIERLAIRAASQKYGISPRTLRFYEDAGILTSHRLPDSGYREYDGAQIKRLEIILLLRGLGFTVREIAELLNGDARLREAMRKKITQSDLRLLELRETNRMLHRLETELSRVAPDELNAADILDELVFLTKQTERMFRMNQSEKYMILLGADIWLPVCGENTGNLPGKIAVLRESSGGFPMIRIRDVTEIKPMEAVIIWDGTEVWRADCNEGPLHAVKTIIDKIKALI